MEQRVPEVRQLRPAANRCLPSLCGTPRNPGPATSNPVGPPSGTKLLAIEMATGPWASSFSVCRGKLEHPHAQQSVFSPKMFCSVPTRNESSTPKVLVGHDGPPDNSVNFGRSHVGCSPVLRVAVLLDITEDGLCTNSVMGPRDKERCTGRWRRDKGWHRERTRDWRCCTSLYLRRWTPELQSSSILRHGPTHLTIIVSFRGIRQEMQLRLLHSS